MLTDRDRARMFLEDYGHEQSSETYLAKLADMVRQAREVERHECAMIAEAPAWSAPTANGEWALREVAKIVATEIRARR